jgi:hypothetical protein
MMPKRKFWLTGYFEDVSEHEMPRVFDSNLFGAICSDALPSDPATLSFGRAIR